MSRKTYTGRTVGGGLMTVECPEWCVTDHAYWGDTADDMFHQSEPAELIAPRDRAGFRGPRYGWPMLSARLRLHSTDQLPGAASVWLEPDEHTDHAVELDLAGVEQLLARVDDFRARLAEIGNLLAVLDAARREVPA